MSERPILGIDLGTTYSCVAQLDEDGRPVVLMNSEDEWTTPSVVYYESADNILVGKAAKREADGPDQNKVVQFAKRDIGEPEAVFFVGDEEVLPQEVSADVLRYVVRDALQRLNLPEVDGQPAARAVITVPAYFGDTQRRLTRDAAKMANIDVIDVLNEPTAAAIALGAVEVSEPRNILVYDLGGGTFDVTVITVSPGPVIDVVATAGSKRLGGADWDGRLRAMLIEEFQALYPGSEDPALDLDSMGKLGIEAEQLKMTLSKKESATAAFYIHGQRARVEVSREGFLERTSDLLDRTMEFTRSVLATAKEKGVDRIDDLILVGGMSKSPIVLQKLVQEFPELPEPRLVDPDQIVAKGAALYAASQLIDPSDGDDSQHLPGPRPTPIIVRNVTSKGYGLKIVNGPNDEIGEVAWMIKPNEKLPIEVPRTFRTVYDGQTGVHMEIFESQTDHLSTVVADNVALVDGMIEGMPSGLPAGSPINVAFNLGNDGILIIEAESHGRKLRLEAAGSLHTPEETIVKTRPSIMND